jgi:hypothetical protein
MAAIRPNAGHCGAIVIASILRNLRALAKGIEDEAQEKDRAERAKNPIGHRLIHSVDVVSITATIRQ